MSFNRRCWEEVKPSILWSGDPIEVQDAPESLEARYKFKGDLEFYEQCIFNHLTLKVGNYVLVSQTNIAELDSLEGCDVARIDYLYENLDPDCKQDHYRAIVTWFSHPDDLPKKILKSGLYTFRKKIDVIEDIRYGVDISIETIVNICKVEIHREQTDYECRKSRFPSFVCRYKLVKRTANAYDLEPKIPDPRAKVTKTPSKTPSKRASLLAQNEQTASPKIRLVRNENNDEWTVEKTPKKAKDGEMKEFNSEQNGSQVKIIFRASPKAASPSAKKDSPKKRRSRKLSWDDECSTPKKSRTASEDTPSRRSILKTPNRRSEIGTPKRRVQVLETVEEDCFENKTPRKHRTPSKSTPKRQKSVERTPKSSKKTPRRLEKSFYERTTPLKPGESHFQVARARLHVSAVPKSLPCREKEFKDIYSFLEAKLVDNHGGCIYISGVPGTGKTATVTEVIRSLQQDAEDEEIPAFDFVNINGMRLTEPRQVYTHIYRQLTGKSLSSDHAYTMLDRRFTTKAPRRRMTILLVDELDILCNRRQDVVYNLLNWPSLSEAQLVVVTIANTMDLPERLLMGKITSRLGLTRLTFQPYNFVQLQQIIQARLAETDTFHKDAVQLVARKVAAVSGDARRALDICRRATEVTEERGKGAVLIEDVQQALAEMIASPTIQAIKNCSKFEQMFLQAVVAEITRTGVEEINFLGAYTQFESLTAFSGLKTPSPGQTLAVCARLGACRILICEHTRMDIHMKILLNISTDDVSYALQET